MTSWKGKEDKSNLTFSMYPKRKEAKNEERLKIMIPIKKIALVGLFADTDFSSSSSFFSSSGYLLW